MHFFIEKKKTHCYLMTHYFANVLYLSICMLGNCSCFYFHLLTFFTIKFLKNNHRVSNSLDPDQDRHSVGLHLGSNCLQMTKLSTGVQTFLTGKYFSVQYIVSYRDMHACVYHKYSDTLNTFNMLCSLNKAKVIFKGSS